MEERRIYAVDSSSFTAGHFESYAKAIEGAGNVKIINDVRDFLSAKKHPIKRLFQVNEYIKDMIGLGNDEDIIHFLTLDSLYVVPWARKSAHKHFAKIVASLHAVPQNRMKRMLLKYNSRFLDCLIVHSPESAEDLAALGISQVKVLRFPACLTDGEVRKKERKVEAKCTLAALGGTRYSKGLDLLADSLSYLSVEDCNRLKIIAAGKEKDIKFDYLVQSGQKHGVEIQIIKGFISNEQFLHCLQLADAVIVPYRREALQSSSGPLIEGIGQRTPVIGPSYGYIGETIKNNDLGIAFQNDTPESIAEGIKVFLRDGFVWTDKTEGFRTSIMVSYFREKLSELYHGL